MAGSFSSFAVHVYSRLFITAFAHACELVRSSVKLWEGEVREFWDVEMRYCVLGFQPNHSERYSVDRGFRWHDFCSSEKYLRCELRRQRLCGSTFLEGCVWCKTTLLSSSGMETKVFYFARLKLWHGYLELNSLICEGRREKPYGSL